MKSWQEITHYAGLDWAKDHHVVVVVNGQGQIVADFEFQHSAEGWQSFITDKNLLLARPRVLSAARVNNAGLRRSLLKIIFCLASLC